MANKRNARCQLLVLAWCCLWLVSVPVRATDWTFTPTIGATQTYSDNITLAPSGQATPGFITNLSPGFQLDAIGSRLNLQLSYTLEDMIYDNYSGAHTYFNQLNANVQTELLQNFFFINGGESINQQPLTLFGPISANAANLSGNVANVYTETINPYFKHDFDGFATALVGFSRMDSSYSYAGPSAINYTNYNVGAANTNLFTSTADIVNANVASGSNFDFFSWAFNYNRTVSAYTGFPSSTISLSSLDLGYLLTPQFKLTSEVGYENDNFVYFGPPPQGLFWDAGFNWAPTPRTQLAITTGERYFGHTYSLNFSHYTRLTAWSASYSNQVTTSIMEQYLTPSSVLDQLLTGQIPDPATRQQTAQQILAALGPQGALFGQNVMTNEVFLAKTLQATVGVNTPRDVLLATVFSSQTQPLQALSAGSGYLLYGDLNQYGATLSLSHEVTPDFRINGSGNYTRMVYQGTLGQENTYMLLFGVSHTINPRLSDSLNFRHQLMNFGLGGYNFQENAVIAGFTYNP